VNRSTAAPAGADVSPELHQQALEKLFRRVGEISSLPTVALRIIEVAGDERAGSAELLEVVEADPALAARILRTVNSSQYGLRRQVGSLKSAITLLGFREIRNLALTVYVARQFETAGTYRCYSRENLWNHLVTVGSISRLVARACGLPNTEEAYLAGLLHDLGMILIDQHMHQHFCRIIDRLNDDTATTAVERWALSFDHCQLGAYVARQWHFPEDVVSAIQYHHDPEGYTGDQPDLLHVVSVANFLACRDGVTSLGVANVAPPGEFVLGHLGLETERLSTIYEFLNDALVQADALVAI